MAGESERVTAPSWVRYAGVVIIAGALLELFTSLFIEVVFPQALVPGTRDAAIVADVVITYLILGGIGVVALYVRYNETFGWIGNLGLLAIGLGVVVGLVATVLTGSAAGNLLNLVLVFGGAALLSVGLWRTPTIPQSAAVLMAVTPIAAVVTIAAFSRSPESLLTLIAYLALNLVWAGAWIVLGYHLWTGDDGQLRRADEAESV